MSNTLLLTKQGRNISIVAIDDTTRVRYFFEDSSNVELIYNVYNNRVTLNIKGNFSYTTDDISGGGVLSIDSGTGAVDITNYNDFQINYTLLFLNTGGSGTSGLLTADNGLTANSSTNVQLGGTLIKTTLIDVDDNIFQIKNAFTSIIYTDSNNLVGINTITPVFNLDVNGIINTNNGVNIATNGAKTGFYGNANTLDIWTGNNKIATWGLANVGGTLYDHFMSWVYTTGFTGESSAFRIASGLTSTGTNNASLSQLLINPSYAQQTFGTGTLRGIYYNPIIGTLNGSTHIAIATTSGDILLDNFNLLNVTGNNSQVFKIDTSTIDLYSGASGLNINASLGVTSIGDVNSYGQATNIQIFDQSGIIQTIFAQYANGFYLNFANGNHLFGDYTGNISQTYLNIDALAATSLLFSNVIELKGYNGNGGNAGFSSNSNNGFTTIGDFNGTGNATYIEIDDINQKMNFRNASGTYNFGDMPVYTDNTDALAHGLILGDIYRHGGVLGESQDQLRIVH